MESAQLFIRRVQWTLICSRIHLTIKNQKSNIGYQYFADKFSNRKNKWFYNYEYVNSYQNKNKITIQINESSREKNGLIERTRLKIEILKLHGNEKKLRAGKTKKSK